MVEKVVVFLLSSQLTIQNLLCLGRDSSLHLKEGMKGQLTEASSATSKAYCMYRREMDPELDLVCAGSDGGNAEEKSAEEASMSPAIAIMRPILRFLQLLCENHNRELQVCECDVSTSGPGNSIWAVGTGIWAGQIQKLGGSRYVSRGRARARYMNQVSISTFFGLNSDMSGMSTGVCSMMGTGRVSGMSADLCS